MTIPESYRRSPVRGPRFEKPRHHVEQSMDRGVRIFTGHEKQPKILSNPVIFDQEAVRRQPYQENDWEDNERTPNRSADRSCNSRSDSDGERGYDVRRSVLENALNVAFLAANSNQLRLLTTSNNERQDTISYQAVFGLIVVSLILQILNCVSMVIMSTLSSNRWPLLRTLACIVATVIALLNLAVVTMLNVLLE
ncbi:uncharacterized protein LOC118458151 [Anopheles albimanus]|uniref:uncharacterized protein LOC118458151 n=1 Tax=Anopheles albimanus TaxID=7167 RepID=UPI00164189BF|nr:uncharacterized protein LOC118458151 [Anopheles albimanus]